MKLKFDQIKEIITGAVRVTEKNGAVELYRLTEEQEELYRATNFFFYNRSFSSAGIKLLFRTDSKTLFLKLTTARALDRQYFSVDILVDGEVVGYLDNFSDISLPQNYTQTEFPLGEFSKEFQLGNGIKTVCIHMPWSTRTTIEEIVVDDGAFVEGIKKKKKLLVYGDSITHGYDALRPSNRYIAKLADALDAEEFNKAVGGAMFFPEFAELKDSIVPDYITVAYGTNDWTAMNKCSFEEKCKAFYETISRNYPEAKIFAITPIWRKDMNAEMIFGDFEQVEMSIRHSVKELKNVTVISGFEFVPKEEKFFADLRLHPNDEGFGHYFNNLYDEIKSKI